MNNMSWQPGMTLADIEKSAIQQAIKFYHGNHITVAGALGMDIDILKSKIKKYEAEKEDNERINNAERQKRTEFIERQRGAYKSTIAPSGGTNISGSDAGFSVESSPKASPEHEVSVPKRTEVQSMLPPSHSQGRHRRHR